MEGVFQVGLVVGGDQRNQMGKKCVFTQALMKCGHRLCKRDTQSWDFLREGLIQKPRVEERGRVRGSWRGPGAASPSRDMPTERHFLKRHCWQRLRLMRMMEQFSFFRHLLYWMFCWMLRRKKPCGAGQRVSIPVQARPMCPVGEGHLPPPSPPPCLTLQPSQACTP